MSYVIDLTIPEMAYAFGFLQADGHLAQYSRNRGRLSVEIKKEDSPLLKVLQTLFSVYSSITFRKRDTNFKDGAESACWKLCDRGVRESLHALGLPYGRKSKIVGLPNTPFSERDYFRGILDADGSLGITGLGYPFVSWCTASPVWSKAISTYIEFVTGKPKNIHLNKRDGVYNIASFKEEAQDLAANLYYDGCLALPRKWMKSREVLQWIRPMTMQRVTWERRRWSPDEDVFILNNSVQKSVAHLHRTERGIRIRLLRITNFKA